MRSIARLVQAELGAAGHDLLTEIDEGHQDVAQIHQLRATAVKRDDVAAERGLHRREAPELVQHHIGDGIALQFNHDAHTVAIGLVTQVGDTLQPLLANEFGHLLDQRRLVHLIRDLGDDQGFAILADSLDGRLGAHHHGAAPRHVGGADAGPAKNGTAGREIRSGHELDQILKAHIRLVDQRDRRIDDLAEIVRRDVGGHADGDAARAIHQQVRKTGRQDDGFLLLAIVVRLEIDRIGIDILDQGQGRPRQARFGVAHRRRRIAIDRAEIALAIDQRQPHREGLCHTHERVVDRAVTMRMVRAHHVADDTGGFHIGAIGGVIALLHRVQNAPVDRLQAVAHIRQSAADDHAHRVIEVGPAHFVGDGNRADVGAGGFRFLVVGSIGQKSDSRG